MCCKLSSDFTVLHVMNGARLLCCYLFCLTLKQEGKMKRKRNINDKKRKDKQNGKKKEKRNNKERKEDEEGKERVPLDLMRRATGQENPLKYSFDSL